MTSDRLIRLAGLAALLAGGLRVISSFIPYSEGSLALEGFYFVIDVLLLFGVIGLYAFQAEPSGRWGFAGFLLATIGVSLIVGPDGELRGVSMYPIGAFLFSLGMSLFAVGSWVARRIPRWPGVCFIASLIVGTTGFLLRLQPLFVIAGGLFGAGFIGAGWTVWRFRPAPTAR